MKRKLALIGIASATVAVIALSQAQAPRRAVAGAGPRKNSASDATFLITFGEKSGLTSNVEGEVNPGRCQLKELRSYKFEVKDQLLPPTRWSIAARPRVTAVTWPEYYPPEYMGKPTAGLILTVQAEPGCEVSVSSSGGSFSFRPGEVAFGSPAAALDGEVHIARMAAPAELGGAGDADYPSIAADRSGGLWAVWAEYQGRQDELGLRYFKDGAWSQPILVPGNCGDVWWPQVVVDGASNPWVIWSQQCEGNWDLYAISYRKDSNAWSRIERLTNDPLPDSYPNAVADEKGNIYVVWQGFRGKHSQIFLRIRSGETWSQAYQISSAEANNWEPSVTVDSTGRVWVAWDTYKDGNYDVYLRSFKDGRLGAEMAVAATPRYEARASVVADRQDRIWIAWEEGDANWGKGTGRPSSVSEPGTPLGHDRRVKVAVLSEGRLRAPAEQLDRPGAEGSASFQPRLLLDGNGNPAILFQRRIHRYAPWPKAVWEQQVTVYRGNQWTTAVRMPFSWNRPSTRGAAVATNGEMWVAYATDNRAYSSPHVSGRQQAFAARMASFPAANPVLAQRPPEETQFARAHPNEAGDLAAIRSYTAKIDGKETHVLRGDTHRHTELSPDEGGINDGSVLEFFRYMLDAAEMDWGNFGDHAGGTTKYTWWLTNKLADMHHLPGAYTALFGYERSVVYPNGHRNVLSASRSLSTLRLLRGLTFAKLPAETTEYIADVSEGTGPLVENDTKKLYEDARRQGGIVISHASAGGGGTDWRDNDPELEPVVEIFQGCRDSNYEQAGAPRAVSAETPREKYKPDGFVKEAWAKGYKLGVIASSDHQSTHMSYAMVYTADSSRQGIIDAIKRRHTYGATDNIILDFGMAEHFMGDEFTAPKPLPMRIYVRGTDEIAAIRLIRDSAVIHSFSPGVKETRQEYVDADLAPGGHYYYIRVEQKNGELAWSSPIWVTYK